MHWKETLKIAARHMLLAGRLPAVRPPIS